MKRKNFNLFFSIGIILVLSLYFVSANSIAKDVVFNQNASANYDEGGVLFVNWTADASVAANYTIYLWMNNNFVNETENVNNSATGYSWGANITEANYTFTIEAVTAANATETNATNVSIYIDNTAPLVNWTGSGYTNLTYKKNTALLTLNISVGDALSGVASGNSYCVFEINGTNETVAISSGWCNTTQLNLTGLVDGNHTIDIWANDTINNVGVNLSTYIVWVDTTAPVATFTCAPSSVGSGSDTICTCTGTDTSSGVNTSLTTAAVTITTNTTLGLVTTGTSNCTITDYAGNTHNATGTYTVTSDSATDATSGTTSLTPPKWTGTFAINDNQFNNGYTNQLGVKKRIRFRVENVEHHVGVLELTITTAKIEVASTPQEATLAIGDTRKFDVSEDGYYDVVVTLNSISDSKVDLTVKYINEIITEEAEAGEQEKEESAEKVAEDGGEVQESSSIFKKWWFWLIVILIIVGVGYSSQKKK